MLKQRRNVYESIPRERIDILNQPLNHEQLVIALAIHSALTNWWCVNASEAFDTSFTNRRTDTDDQARLQSGRWRSARGSLNPRLGRDDCGASAARHRENASYCCRTISRARVIPRATAVLSITNNDSVIVQRRAAPAAPFIERKSREGG